jgi:hypothetical protein
MPPVAQATTVNFCRGELTVDEKGPSLLKYFPGSPDKSDTVR